ncbi:MAG: LEA type 2 family protein [Oligoflexia bacterium]
MMVFTRLLFLVVLAGCATPSVPKARFKEMQFESIHLKHTSWRILLEVENENFIGAPISALQYEAFLDEKRVGSGALPAAVTLPGSSASEVSLPIQIPHSSVVLMTELLKGRKELPYRVRGSATVLGITIPFEKTGIYTIPPELSQQAQELSGVGAKTLLKKLLSQ